MNKLLSPKPFLLQEALLFLRITVAAFCIYHGWEVFDKKTMQGYAEWPQFHGEKWLPYLGKAAELVGGIFLLLGFFTRAAVVLLAGTFLFIAFFVGKGKFWYEDQPPMLFALFMLLFFFAGAGKWSIDYLLFYKKTK